MVILPLGGVSPALEIGGWTGTAHGLSRVDGLPTKNAANPTSVRPGTFPNNQRQRLEVSVQTKGRTTAIIVSLNRKELFRWSGKIARLQENFVMKLPVRNAIGLAVHRSEVLFHRATLSKTTAVIATAEKPKPAPTKGLADIDVGALGDAETPGWEVFNGAAFSRAIEKGSTVARSRPGVGAADRGAYLVGTEFSTGSIEIDLKGARQPGGSFIGVAFHGVDGKTYDSVYFRPFNFGHRDPVKRGHAVQYMSHPI